MAINFISFRRVTWEESNAEAERYWAEHLLPQRTPEEEQREREYWAKRTIAERIEAYWALAKRERANDKLKLADKPASHTEAGKEL